MPVSPLWDCRRNENGEKLTQPILVFLHCVCGATIQLQFSLLNKWTLASFNLHWFVALYQMTFCFYFKCESSREAIVEQLEKRVKQRKLPYCRQTLLRQDSHKNAIFSDIGNNQRKPFQSTACACTWLVPR